MRRLITSQRGFSIIEAMVAFGILAVGMMAVASMITTSMQFDRRSISKRDAFNVAMEKFEEIKGDYIATSGSVLDPIEEDVAGGFHRKSEFVGCLRCEQVEASVPIYLCAWKVKITVGWGDAADCTKADPGKCPNKSEFTNYVVIRKTNNTCPAPP